MDTVSGTVMVAITSAGVLRTTLPKPDDVAAVLIAAIMLDAKDVSAAAAARVCIAATATACLEQPYQ
jgi:hypothetical protein